MSLTANFDYCVELGIAQVREIFHLAFKSEDRYPHNIGPLTRSLTGREFTINVRVHDDNDRPAELNFQDEKHFRFTFPFDLTTETPDAPDPALSRVTLQVIVEVPGLLDNWVEEGEDVLGVSFLGITATDVNITRLDGLPTIDINNFLAAIHNRYDTISHVYTDATSGSRLVLYDGNRDNTLNPPNSSGDEITAALETHSGDEYLKITAPIHVTVPLPSGGDYTSYGRLIFWRQVLTTDTTIAVQMGSEPALATLRTTVELNNVAGQQQAELTEIVERLHTTYDVIDHTRSMFGTTVTFYDGERDLSLVPPNKIGLPEITAVFETHSGTEYLKVTLPIHVAVSVPVYLSYGTITFWREVTRTDTTLSVNFAIAPANPALQTSVALDVPEGGLVSGPLASQVGPALAAFGTLSGPSFGAVEAQLIAMATTGINNFGTVIEPAFSESAARDLLRTEIAAYLSERRYPFYSPKSPDPEDEPLSTPVGFLLLPDNVLAILLNRRTGTPADDHAPDNFLGSNPLALAVGRAKVDEVIGEAIIAQFPELSKSNGSYTGQQPIETDEGDATLFELAVVPANPGAHGESRGHLWVSGEAEVHIDCWPDPDVTFSGPIFIDAVRVDSEEGCTLELQARAGEFDVDQSCCDVLLDLLIPIVGWIMLVIIENCIDAVGGELAADIAAGQAEAIEPIPPVINGIAEVTACLEGLDISSQGFVFPGEIYIRRLGRSYEDLMEDSNRPRP